MANGIPSRRSFSRYGVFAILGVVLAFTACDSATAPLPEEWPVSTPASQHLDATLLAELADSIELGAYGTLHSVLILRHGHLAWERYFNGWSADELHPVYSVTKSVTSALVGIALNERRIPALDASVLEYFPQYPTLGNPDARKAQITIEHVLMMRAGFVWNEFTIPYSDPANSYRQMVASPNWIKFVLDLPLAADPNTRFTYNTGCTMLLSGVLGRATGQSVEAYAIPRLFAPLGITAWVWGTSPQGLSNTGAGLQLRPRDMARFGYLYLHGGSVNGERVVPADWVARSTTAYSGGFTTYGYGYQWWTLPSSFRGADGTDPGVVFFAWGYGSQMIFVLPRYDMVVVTTGANYGESSDQPVRFLRTHVIPAVLDR